MNDFRINKNHIKRTFGGIMSESDITADAAESIGLNEITVVAILGIVIAGIFANVGGTINKGNMGFWKHIGLSALWI